MQCGVGSYAQTTGISEIRDFAYIPTTILAKIVTDKGNVTGIYDTPTILVKIEGREVNATVDSGASVCCFSGKLYQQLINEGVKVMTAPVGNLICRLAIGRKQHTIKLQAMFNVEIGGEMFEIMFLIVNHLLCDMLIGVDILKEYNAN